MSIKKSIRKIAVIIGISILGLLALAQIGGWAYQRDVARGETLTDEEYLSRMASEVTMVCPIEVERNIIIRKAVAYPGKVLIYDNQVTNMSADDPVLAPLLEMMQEPLVEWIKTTPEFARIRGMEATIVYEYYDKYNDLIASIIVSPEMYQ